MFGINCRTILCQFKHSETVTDSQNNEEVVNEQYSTYKPVQEETFKDDLRLNEALDKVDSLEQNKKDFEAKLRLYSTTIQKLRKEK